MKKVILITDVCFWEQGSGHRARISSLVKFLASKVSLTVACTGPASFITEEQLTAKYGISFILLEKNRILSSTGYVRKLKPHIENQSFDAVIIEYIHSTYFLALFVLYEQMVTGICIPGKYSMVDIVISGSRGCYYCRAGYLFSVDQGGGGQPGRDFKARMRFSCPEGLRFMRHFPVSPCIRSKNSLKTYKSIENQAQSFQIMPSNRFYNRIMLFLPVKHRKRAQ